MSFLRPSRRDILKMSAVAPALAFAAPASASFSAPSTGQSEGFFRFNVGEAQLIIVSDGYFTRPARGIGINAPEDEVVAFLEAHFQDTNSSYIHTNHVVIELSDSKILIDVGSGNRLFPTTGYMLENLAASGIAEEEITHVALTHAHPDHVWGIRDDFDEAIFPGAEYLIGSAEFSWWMTDDRVHLVDERDQAMVVGAVNSLRAAEPQLTLASDGHEIVPGVRMIATPGHTIGHMSVIVESEGESLLILGDAIRDPYVSLERPEWVSDVDMIPDLTVETRIKLLDMTATDRIAILSYHFPFPGAGHVMKDQNSYRSIPAMWKWNEG